MFLTMDLPAGLLNHQYIRMPIIIFRSMFCGNYILNIPKQNIFNPWQFAVGTILAAAGLVLCVQLVFGHEGLEKAWWPLGLFFTVVIAIAVFFGKRASDRRRQNVEAVLTSLQQARAEATPELPPRSGG